MKGRLLVVLTIALMGAGITRETHHRLRMVTLRRPSDGFTWGQQPGQVVD